MSIGFKVIALYIYIYIYIHYDVMKWKHFLLYCPFVQGIHRSPMVFPHKGIVTCTFGVSKQPAEQTLDWLVIRYAMTVICRHRI